MFNIVIKLLTLLLSPAAIRRVVCTVRPMTISIEHIDVTIAGERVLQNVDLKVEGPALIAVLGPNGAGKTTLLRTILGFVKPSNGRVLVNDLDITGKPRLAGTLMSYVPQRPPLSRFAPISVLEFLCTSLALRRGWPRHKCNDKDMIISALEQAGVPPSMWNKKLDELSGGNLMRVFIARSLLIDKPIMIMDEPFAPIDPDGRVSMARLIGSLAREKLLIISLHDYLILEEYIDKIVLINKRLIAYGSPSNVLKPEILRLAYGPSFRVVEKHIHIYDWHA